MELNRYELLQIYSGLEKVWKDRIQQSNKKYNSNRDEYLKEEIKKVNDLRIRISHEIQRI